jgi:hypothetical protein
MKGGMMHYAKILTPLLIIVALVMSCAQQNDEDAIQALLESSWFVGEGMVRTADDSTSTPKPMSGLQVLADTIGYVRWVRWIERPVIREYDIVVQGDSADVTITTYLSGNPPGYGIFINNDPFGPIYQRSINDIATRRVKLYRSEDGVWRLASLTVADLATIDALHPISITEIIARVPNRNYEFVVNSPNTYFKKDELPIFYPSDTVEVTVTCSADGDSTWAFLHHGIGHRPGFGSHRRQPFYRETTTSFTRTWIIADDSVAFTPSVRHSATDVLGWETLFGDSTASYYSRAWGLPYIIIHPGEDLPEDKE